MGGAVNEIDETCARLRRAQHATLAPLSQAEVVAAVCGWAALWADQASAWRREAQTLLEPFPIAMTRVSLDALLESLTSDALWSLIDAEGVRGRSGAPLIGHVVAGNTPLLAWTSILRALLMRSASFVKLPSGGAGDWARLFVRTLSEVSPALASGVHLSQWPGGTPELDAALCRNVDLLLAYGGQDALRSLRSLCPDSVAFVGYGHRVSFGIVPAGSPPDAAAHGFARDVLLYDQGGCLSPHTIFVEGDLSAAVAFAARLADALAKAVTDYPQPVRTPRAAARVREARALARMEAEAVLWEDGDLRWTVVARREESFAVSPTHGVISVQPHSGIPNLPRAVAPVAGHLQGCAIAADRRGKIPNSWHDAVARLGASWICRPGELQALPFTWREDGHDVLCSLLPASGPEAAKEATGIAELLPML